MPIEHQHLTTGEREVLRLYALGLSDRQIAEHLAISLRAVRGRLEGSYQRSGTSGRRAVVWAVRHSGCCLAGNGSDS